MPLVRPLAMGLVTMGLVALAGGCPPPRAPEQNCIEACRARLTKCTPVECRRGCRLALDRLVEREEEAVFRCMAEPRGRPALAGVTPNDPPEPNVAAPRREHGRGFDDEAAGVCPDALWAECSARVGPHLDGGPPAPAPPEDD